VDRIEGDDIIWVLDKQISEFTEFIHNIPEDKKNYSYAPGKWTTAEVLGHINDTERVMAYRAFWFARKAPSPLSGFEQDEFIKVANFNNRTLQSFAEEFIHLRKSNNSLFKNLGEEALRQHGLANNKSVSVNALLYIIAGHLEHHITILNERYLNQ
ncbi:MAG: DinB family protein, partial [Ignavibacteriaceae bacterium]|nr:DinB family protein [Ignavibacteriaceae bacterium]